MGLEILSQAVSYAGVILGWSAVIVLCGVGLLMTIVSISGTWLILGAAILASFLTGAGEFPGRWTLLGMGAVCAGVDLAEWLAARWGVRRRGGSSAAGWLALLGSILGALFGSLLLPLLGSFLGMIVGSFLLVYAAEWHRHRHSAKAAHIARGALWAGLMILALKIAAATGLLLWLAFGLTTRTGEFPAPF